ncbi:MAG: hypothetical protein INR62_06085 [Rhodospirillales bacterium]|nr:hypothetical protein [Acetobacter sp.]
MLKPDAFQKPFVALRNIPYLYGEPASRDHLQGGVLRQGQTVWTKSTAVPSREVRSEAAFVEGVGVVSLDPHWLIPAEIVKRESRGG